MYEHGINVEYETRGHNSDPFGPRQRVALPGWCAGDVQGALALYLHGHSTLVDYVRVIDWQPR